MDRLNRLRDGTIATAGCASRFWRREGLALSHPQRRFACLETWHTLWAGENGVPAPELQNRQAHPPVQSALHRVADYAMFLPSRPGALGPCQRKGGTHVRPEPSAPLRTRRPPHRPAQAERPRRHRPQPAGADGPAATLPPRPHQLGRQPSLRRTAARPPRPRRSAALRPRRLRGGSGGRRGRSPASRDQCGGCGPTSSSICKGCFAPACWRWPAGRPGASASARPAKGRRGSTPTWCPCRISKAFTRWIATGWIAEALGAGGGPKQFRLSSPTKRRRWAGERLADLPRPWLAVGVGFALARPSAGRRNTSPHWHAGARPLRRHGRVRRRPATRRPLADAVAAKLAGPTLQPRRPDDAAAADGACWPRPT